MKILSWLMSTVLAITFVSEVVVRHLDKLTQNMAPQQQDAMFVIVGIAAICILMAAQEKGRTE